jgi:peptidoglycan/LPS O-acetylase OafA/YrhL
MPVRHSANPLPRRLRQAVATVALALAIVSGTAAAQRQSSPAGALIGLLVVLVLLAVAVAVLVARRRPGPRVAGPTHPSACAGCGAELALGARSCPSCGRATG